MKCVRIKWLCYSGPSLTPDNGGDGGDGDGGSSSHGNNRHENDHDDGPSTSRGRRHQKPKTAQQRAGEALLRYIIQNTNGASYSFA